MIQQLGMADLPEAWLLEESTMEAQLQRQKGPVTDIFVRVQCYATFVSTMAQAYIPAKISELMAYMATIMRCHRDYDGPSWVLYDRAFPHRAEATKGEYFTFQCFGGGGGGGKARICQLCAPQ